MEKRLRDIDSRCQDVVKEVEEMKKELRISQQQAQKLLGILASKKILDSGNYTKVLLILIILILW